MLADFQLVTNVQFDQAMDDAARWLGARLSLLVDQVDPFHVASDAKSRARQLDTQQEIRDEADAALEALRAQRLVRGRVRRG